MGRRGDGRRGEGEADRRGKSAQRCGNSKIVKQKCRLAAALPAVLAALSRDLGACRPQCISGSRHESQAVCCIDYLSLVANQLLQLLTGPCVGHVLFGETSSAGLQDTVPQAV